MTTGKKREHGKNPDPGGDGQQVVRKKLKTSKHVARPVPKKKKVPKGFLDLPAGKHDIVNTTYTSTKLFVQNSAIAYMRLLRRETSETTATKTKMIAGRTLFRLSFHVGTETIPDPNGPWHAGSSLPLHAIILL